MLSAALLHQWDQTYLGRLVLSKHSGTISQDSVLKASGNQMMVTAMMFYEVVKHVRLR